MVETFNDLPVFHQGMIYIMVGAITILYALGIFGKGITVVIILFAVYLIYVGCVKMGILRKLNKKMAEIHHRK